MFFSAYNGSQGIEMYPGADANGGGVFVNQYTIIMDFFRPTTSDGSWQALYNTSPDNANDAELYIDTTNGIGIDGDFEGVVTANQWHRIAWAVDTVAGTISKYIDGTFVGDSPTDGFDGRWSVFSATDGQATLLFTEGIGGRFTAPGYVNSIQVRDGAMTAGEMRYPSNLPSASAEGSGPA